MKAYELLIVALLLTVLAGCTITGNVVNEESTDQPQNALRQELALEDNDDEEPVVRATNVELFLTNGGFSPAVIVTKSPSRVVVTSFYVDDVHFSIAELGVEEPLSEADTFEFVVEEKGEYPYICLDCSPMIKGVLVVE